MLCKVFAGLLAITSLALPAASALAGEVEVLHWWTSKGEAKSLESLKKIIGERGHTWKDFSVTGGGGEAAMEQLKRRTVAGTPPAAAQVKGPAIQEWASTGVLANIDTVAVLGKWDERLPKVVSDAMKYRGQYVAVPVNVHRVNWLWVNADVLKRAGVVAVPKTWVEFFLAAEKIKKAGFTVLAHGNQDWQDHTLFEAVALSVGGADFYRAALIELQSEQLSSQLMTQVLETFIKLKAYAAPEGKSIDWNVSTGEVMQGKAAFQIMGDWAKGEFLAAGKTPGADFLCASVPGAHQGYIFNIDSFILFKLKNVEAQKAQGYFAYSIMEERFQEVFNVNKGSIPARQGTAMTKFDQCAKLSVSDFAAAANAKTLVPSVAHKMAVNSTVEIAMRTIVSELWNQPSRGVELTQKRLVDLPKSTLVGLIARKK